MLPDNTAPISSIQRQHVSNPTATYLYNLLHFSIKINRLVEQAHHSTKKCVIFVAGGGGGAIFKSSGTTLLLVLNKSLSNNQ